MLTKYRVLLYWRPIVPGLNDSDGHIARAFDLAVHAHATVFTGLFYREEIRAYYRAHHLPEPYEDVARRKILPEIAESRILTAFAGGTGSPIFRKTSCAVCFAHGVPDYNGHFGIREVCDICPASQVHRCAQVHQVPTVEQIASAALNLGPVRVVDISARAAVLEGYSEQQRYFLQHAFGFQFHDVAKAHNFRRHGRAELGWEHVEPDHR